VSIALAILDWLKLSVNADRLKPAAELAEIQPAIAGTFAAMTGRHEPGWSMAMCGNAGVAVALLRVLATPSDETICWRLGH
tara:strand:- start:43 stop:285 length:243 start_codon:yes stop_codon:yes gene_type:complete